MTTKESFFRTPFAGLSLFFLLVLVTGCKTDKEDLALPLPKQQITEAHKLLSGEIVLSSHAYMGAVNKTLLPGGSPIKYRFTWEEDDMLNLKLERFSVGNMPLELWFSIDVKFMHLNSWERAEYKGSGWIKFSGEGGITSFTGVNAEYKSVLSGGKAGVVTGYLNVETGEIEFLTNFNLLNFSAEVFRQKIDPSRLARYEEEKVTYAKELQEYKDKHGH